MLQIVSQLLDFSADVNRQVQSIYIYIYIERALRVYSVGLQQRVVVVVGGC